MLLEAASSRLGQPLMGTLYCFSSWWKAEGKQVWAEEARQEAWLCFLATCSGVTKAALQDGDLTRWRQACSSPEGSVLLAQMASIRPHLLCTLLCWGLSLSAESWWGQSPSKSQHREAEVGSPARVWAAGDEER